MQIGNKIDNLKLFFVKVLWPIHHFFLKHEYHICDQIFGRYLHHSNVKKYLFVMVVIKIIKITQPQLLASF